MWSQFLDKKGGLIRVGILYIGSAENKCEMLKFLNNVLLTRDLGCVIYYRMISRIVIQLTILNLCIKCLLITSVEIVFLYMCHNFMCFN